MVQQTQNIECEPMAGGNYSACVSVSDPGTNAREFTGTLSDVRVSSLAAVPSLRVFPSSAGRPWVFLELMQVLWRHCSDACKLWVMCLPWGNMFCACYYSGVRAARHVPACRPHSLSEQEDAVHFERMRK